MRFIPDDKEIMDIYLAMDPTHRPFFFKRVLLEIIAKYIEGCMMKNAL